MTVLIADDEELVRFTVRSMIEEYREGIKIVEAANGKRLLELVEDDPPAIAFVDIRMPSMNGLEAIAEGKKISPLTQWIILTGHSEFEYARDALDLKVNNYLLKPVDVPGSDPKELEERYGGRICFFGGIDQQELLPGGDRSAMKKEITRRAEVMGSKGGYLMAPAHIIQHDTAPETVEFMIETILSLS